ncbi:MAG: CPBP family intramembrane metalloprotease [Candidatus Zixiibacteriota bacterium]|nr:MAG: CPBP family intramembrane metalloprotease [candidate division Zixibacteria bacterium]
MENDNDIIKPAISGLPAAQKVLLIFLLLGYPLLSILFNLIGAGETVEIESRMNQVYVPTFVIHLIILVGIWIGMKKSGGGFAELGLGKKDITASNLLSGIIFFIGAFALMIIIKSSIARSGYLPEKDFAYVLPVTFDEKLFWVMLSVSAALFEEICFRGFIISRLKILSGNYLIGALAGSLAFSLGHLYQGIAGVILTFIYGMLFAGLFIARKSVFPCVVAHFLQDIIILFVVFNI